MNNIDWTSLRDFLAVADSGTLSAAARRLRVSQPTMGRRIAALEERLDSRLFDRTPDGFLLTETGETIMVHARHMEEQALAIERAAQGTDRMLKGTVRISVWESLGVFWLTRRLAKFREAYPGIQVEVHISNEAVSLLRREADIALRAYHPERKPEQADLVARKVARVGYGLFASTAYLERHGMPETVGDLKDHYAIAFDETLDEGRYGGEVFRHFRPENIVYRSNSMFAHVAAAVEGLGIAPIGYSAVRHYAQLRPVLPAEATMHLDVWQITHYDLRRNARIRAVMDFLAQELENSRQELSTLP